MHRSTHKHNAHFCEYTSSCEVNLWFPIFTRQRIPKHRLPSFCFYTSACDFWATQGDLYNYIGWPMPIALPQVNLWLITDWPSKLQVGTCFMGWPVWAHIFTGWPKLYRLTHKTCSFWLFTGRPKINTGRLINIFWIHVDMWSQLMIAKFQLVHESTRAVQVDLC